MSIAVRRPSVAAAVVAVLALTGCTFGTSPVQAPTTGAAEPTTSNPTPPVQPEPIDPLTTVTEIVVRPEQLELLDSRGVVVVTLSDDVEASAFMDTLSTVLGAAPALSERAASMETPATTDLDAVRHPVADRSVRATVSTTCSHTAGGSS